MYWELIGSDEVLARRGFGRRPSSVLPFLVDIRSPDFSAAKWARLQHLALTLEILYVQSIDSSMRTLSKVTPCFPSLRSLHLELKGLKILPEWLGKLLSLEKLYIVTCPNLTYLPESIRNLTALKKLVISGCPRLIERCRGEDAQKISHIPAVIFDGRRFSPVPPSEGSEQIQAAELASGPEPDLQTRLTTGTRTRCAEKKKLSEMKKPCTKSPALQKAGSKNQLQSLLANSSEGSRQFVFNKAVYRGLLVKYGWMI
ncbi:hypothetical protein ACP4OV_023110 [Aristida adscensionis]